MSVDSADKPDETNPLLDLMRTRIERDGPISVADFMALALGHPEHGYYQQAEPFGGQGDFTTAPEISQCFGELIGLWLVQYWRDCGSPDPINLIELGPGRGTLMADALRAAAIDPAFISAARIYMVETSQRLRDIQTKTLGRPITHLNDASTLPEGFSLVVANEFFDALPIRQFIRTDTGWQERRITIDPADNMLAFCQTPLPGNRETGLPAHAARAATGAIVEISPQSLIATRDIAAHIAQNGGAALFIDYGYHADHLPADGRFGETLQALRAHTPWPVLADPGQADITAHVDFTALADTAAADIRVAPITTQSLFLQHLGLAHRLGQLLATAASAEQAREIETAAIRLVDPQQMGDLFKVLGFCQQGQPPMPALENL